MDEIWDSTESVYEGFPSYSYDFNYVAWQVSGDKMFGSLVLSNYYPASLINLI